MVHVDCCENGPPADARALTMLTPHPGATSLGIPDSSRQKQEFHQICSVTYFLENPLKLY